MTEQPAAPSEPLTLSIEEAIRAIEKTGHKVDRSTLSTAAAQHAQQEQAAKNQPVWDIDAQLGVLLRKPTVNAAKIKELQAERTRLEKLR